MEECKLQYIVRMIPSSADIYLSDDLDPNLEGNAIVLVRFLRSGSISGVRQNGKRCQCLVKEGKGLRMLKEPKSVLDIDFVV